MLTLSKVTKKFGSNLAVQDVSLQVEPGTIYSLIGPNGSGKTTIVKIIVGLMQASAGTIHVDGIDVAKQPEKTKALIGYIPDEPQVWEKITGEEFLHLTGSFFGMSQVARTARIKELLPVFSLEGMEKDYFGSYSRGSRQKFSILAALLHKPKLLLIDEPMIGLDPTSAEIAKNLFRSHAKSGGAVLLVTHTLPVAEELSSKVGILEKSKLIAEGSVAELRHQAHVAGDAALESVFTRLIAH